MSLKNLGSLMKQAQQMQARMAEAQESLAGARIDAEAGGGMVRVTVDGRGAVKAVSIAPELADPGEVAVLEDLIVAACGAARDKAEAHAAEEMKKVTGGLALPPGLGPF